jgi:hypothetical protein
MKIAIEELAGCSGCTIAVLDLHEMLLDIVKEAEIVYSPVIMDVKEPPEGIDIAFVTEPSGTRRTGSALRRSVGGQRRLSRSGPVPVTGGYRASRC